MSSEVSISLLFLGQTSQKKKKKNLKTARRRLGGDNIWVWPLASARVQMVTCKLRGPHTYLHMIMIMLQMHKASLDRDHPWHC